MEIIWFQSPLHRGLGSDEVGGMVVVFLFVRYNPLFIGAWVRTGSVGAYHAVYDYKLQSPLHRGLGSDTSLRLKLFSGG